jgi:FtsH-binding integral membrane protein
MIQSQYKRLRDAYILLSLQLLVTFLVVKVIRDNPKYYNLIRQYAWVPIILSFVLLFTIQLGNFSPLVKIMFFTLFSICLGTMCIATSRIISDSIIISSLKATLGIFVSLSVIGWICYIYGINLSRLQFALLIGLIGLLISMIFASSTPKNRRVIFTFGIVLFSILIAVDTYTTLKGKYKDAVTDALGLYLNILNLFQQLIGLKNK